MVHEILRFNFNRFNAYSFLFIILCLGIGILFAKRYFNKRLSFILIYNNYIYKYMYNVHCLCIIIYNYNNMFK